MQERVNSVQRKKQTRHSDWSIIKETQTQLMKCEPCMSQHLATLKNFGRNKGRRFKQVLFSHRTNNTTAEKHLYDRKHIHVCSRRFTTLCGGLWSDCIGSSLQFFLKEVQQMPPISESMADHNSGNYVPYFLQVFWVL